MNIFLREVKANSKALIIWSVCMVLLIGSGMGKYTAYSGGGEQNEVFNKMPQSLKALFGMGDFDVTDMKGYFAMMFLYIELTAAIHAVLLGAGIIAKEERDKTTEFLMTKPVSRVTIITSKLFAAFVNTLILNIVSLISSLAMVATYNKGKDISGEVVVFMLSMFIVQLIFLSLGTCIAAFNRNSKAAVSIATSVMLIAFVISKITDVTNKLDALNILSPFKYFRYKSIVEGSNLNATIVVLSLVLIVLFSSATYRFYLRRDLNV